MEIRACRGEKEDVTNWETVTREECIGSTGAVNQLSLVVQRGCVKLSVAEWLGKVLHTCQHFKQNRELGC